jgi:hypothetical protein
MSSQPDDHPYSESSLESGEYRQRLQRKLNCLIAVLEVALAKVRRSLEGPDPDLERLGRIQKNLGDTLKVCRRAKLALERHDELPSELGAALSGVVQRTEDDSSATRGLQVEMNSGQAAERLASMQPIDNDAIRHVDFDELARLLQD